MVKVCPMCRKTFPTKEALKQHVASVHESSGRPSKSKRSIPNRITSNQSNDIPIRIKRMEFYGSITFKNSSTATFSQSFSPGNSNCIVLSKFGKLYETYKVHGMSVVFKTASRTTRDGQVIVAVDYNTKSLGPVERARLLSMPNMIFPIHKDNSRLRVVVAPTLRYVVSSDLSRDSPFAIQAIATTDTTETEFLCGDIFLEYDIEFMGLRP